MNERLMHKRIRIAGVESTRKSIPLLSPQSSVDFEQLKQQLSTPPGTSQGQPFSVSSGGGGGGGGGGRGVNMASATATIPAAVSEQEVAWRAQVNKRMAEMVTKPPKAAVAAADHSPASVLHSAFSLFGERHLVDGLSRLFLLGT
eukprot:COSAG05_NODE_4136_length_1657_cov_4.010270_1_plen_145_part_00